jgi:hypothetical protein
MTKVDLSQANEILEGIARDDDRFSPVVPEDKKLFEKFLKDEPHSYGNSWMYLTQGLYGIGPGKIGYKFHDGKNLSMVCIYPKIEQDQLMFYWIRPMGPGILPIIKEFSDQLLEKYSIFTYIKKIFPKQHQQLKELGFNDISFFPWHSASEAEDDTYPEVIFDVGKTLVHLTEDNRNSNFRKMYRRVKRLHKLYKVEFVEDGFKEIAWDITNKFFDYDLIKNNDKNVSRPGDYFNLIFSGPSSDDLDRRIIMIDGKPLGYYVLKKQNDEFSSLYAQINLREELKYLSEIVFFEILEKCTTPKINLGGSENSGIDEFKKKFKHSDENQMKWLTNYKA